MRQYSLLSYLSSEDERVFIFVAALLLFWIFIWFNYIRFVSLSPFEQPWKQCQEIWNRNQRYEQQFFNTQTHKGKWDNKKLQRILNESLEFDFFVFRTWFFSIFLSLFVSCFRFLFFLLSYINIYIFLKIVLVFAALAVEYLLLYSILLDVAMLR